MTISKALFSFDGRISRSDFWLKGVIILLPFGLINSIIFWSNPEEPNPVSIVISLLLMYPFIALYVKRLHDHSRSGWFLATLLIPFANFIFLIWIIAECWFMKGKKGPNRFGDDPLESNSKTVIVADNNDTGNNDKASSTVNVNKQEKEADVLKKKSNSDSLNRFWYIAYSPDKIIKQVVLKIPETSVTKTEFSSIMLPYDNFPIISSNPWCSGLMRMSSHPMPYILIRVGDFAEKVKSCDLTIAFSFCKLPSSGIFLMDTRIESEEFTSEVRNKYSVAPPLKKPLVEWIVSANDNFSMKMLDEIIAHEKLHIVIAENSSNMTSTVYMPDGSTIESVAPSAHHDRIITMDNELRKLLKSEYENLITYQKSIPYSKKNFNEAMYELGVIMPVDKDPIYPEL